MLNLLLWYWKRQFEHDNLSAGLWPFVWSRAGVNYIWEYQLLPQICLYLPWTHWWKIHCCPPCTAVLNWPAFMNCMECCLPPTTLFCFFCFSRLSARTARTCSCRHRYLPYCRDVLHSDRICAIVVWPPHRWHDGSSIRAHVCRFIGDGSVSHTDRSKMEFILGPSFHSSDKDILRSGRFHFLHAPNLPSCRAWFFFVCSSFCLNIGISWTCKKGFRSNF